MKCPSESTVFEYISRYFTRHIGLTQGKSRLTTYRKQTQSVHSDLVGSSTSAWQSQLLGTFPLQSVRVLYLHRQPPNHLNPIKTQLSPLCTKSRTQIWYRSTQQYEKLQTNGSHPKSCSFYLTTVAGTNRPIPLNPSPSTLFHFWQIRELLLQKLQCASFNLTCLNGKTITLNNAIFSSKFL